MSVIFCPINLFDKYQTIYKLNNNSQEVLGKIDLANIEEFLVNTCHNEKIYKIHILGENDFAPMIAEKVKKYELMQYSYNKIEVEVN
jgi:hypothetical protein